MQRYNIFHRVHKGLRALLYETAMQVQHTDFWNVEESEELIERMEELVRLFEKHAHTEDHFVFPAVEKYEPSVADAFEQEHKKDHLLGQLLTAAMDLYRNAEVITDKAQAGCQVSMAYAKFMAFNIEHMAKEEEILNSILWRYYSDAELLSITREILSQIPVEYGQIFSKWMLRGLNNAEITGWLKEVERSAPEPVFQSLFIAAERVLPGTRFRQVLEGLTEGAMLA